MTATPTARTGVPQRTEWVQAARVRLLQQRAFRSKQLAELARRAPDGPVADAATREIQAALRVAAETALAEIDAALRRIDRGTFGRCPRCGAVVSSARLEAVPSAALCAVCHRARDLGAQARLTGGAVPVARRRGTSAAR